MGKEQVLRADIKLYYPIFSAVGFTSAGITAGSYAAGLMSSAAIANGGGVAAGSMVSIVMFKHVLVD